MKRIPLYRRDGSIANYTMVDDEDYESLSCHKWGAAYSKYTCYAVRHKRSGSKNNAINMHREILLLSRESRLVVDHVDRNGLNNQRYNIRACTRVQNSYNKIIARKSKTGFRGVYRVGLGFQAAIRVSNAFVNLGFYKNPELAHAAYIKAAKEIHGEFFRA